MAPRHTLLVVDDEPNVVKSVQDLMRLEYRVLGAVRAREGLGILESEQVHIVMSDQRMPEMTGIEFLEQVRETHPDVVRMLFTGYSDIRAVIEAINRGHVYRYIVKPWDPEELQVVVREAADRYDLLAERQRLLAELGAKNAELERANAELKKTSDLKSAFIEVASHELRTPLTILLGLTTLAAGSAQAPPPVRHWLERIQGAAERLHGLVDQIVSMLAVGNFVRPLRIEPQDLGAVLREAAADVQPFIDLRRQSLSIELPEGLGTIPMEAAKVRDSVNHLLVNAIKFTPDEGRIVLSARRTASGGAEVRVSDTGTGIPPADQERMFEPFFTGFDVLQHASRGVQFGSRGLGLGLSLVKRLIEMHGGAVSVESKLGAGSTFTIRLPGGP